MSKWHGGKGSTPRPISDRKQYSDNWEKIFGVKGQQQQPNKSTEEEERIKKEQAQDPRNG